MLRMTRLSELTSDAGLRLHQLVVGCRLLSLCPGNERQDTGGHRRRLLGFAQCFAATTGGQEHANRSRRSCEHLGEGCCRG